MYNDSRIDLYNYIYSLVYGKVTNNVYRMGEPTENTEDDTKNGFVVIEVGDILDDSEFLCNAYGRARCMIIAFIPKKSRGRLDIAKYKEYESAINEVIREAILSNDNETYSILGDGVLSLDDDEQTQKGNQYHLYIKSFIVEIDKDNN